MQYAFFTIPLRSGDGAVDEMNRFLRANRILAVDKRMVEGGENPYWSFCVEYLDHQGGGDGFGNALRQPKIDYKQILPPDQFVVFSRLRALRKEMAEKEAVPVYTLFTNEQLAAMVTGRVTTPAGLEAIEGVGPARSGKYGEAFLKILVASFGDAGVDETGADGTK